MKPIILAIIFVSQIGIAARIDMAYWDRQTKSVHLQLVYQGGHEKHEFTIDWDPCALDETTNQMTRFGQILDTGWQDTGSDELVSQVRAQEPKDGCEAKVLILKSTSSNTPFIVEKF